MIDAYVAEMNGSPYGGGGGGGGGGDEAVSELTDEDRRALLGSLKAKWDSVNSKYQKMCIGLKYRGCFCVIKLLVWKWM